MKKLVLVLLASLFVISGSTQVFGQSKLERKRDRAKAQSASKLVKRLKKEGWIIDSQTLTLEEAILDHKVKLEKDENNFELVGRVSGVSSRNVAHNNANHNAAIAYAQLAKKSMLRGAEESNVGSIGGEEFDNFTGAYERLVAGSLEKELKESFAIYKEGPGGKKEYNVYYIVNEDKAAQLRINAMNKAIEETKLSQEFADRISSFVRDKFDAGE